MGAVSGCCGIAEEHIHLCYLGPLGWLVYEVLPKLWRRLSRMRAVA